MPGLKITLLQQSLVWMDGPANYVILTCSLSL